jgi:hypothetical protein
MSSESATQRSTSPSHSSSSSSSTSSYIPQTLSLNSKSAVTSTTDRRPTGDKDVGPPAPKVLVRPKPDLDVNDADVIDCLQKLRWTQRAWQEECDHLKAVLGEEHYAEVETALAGLVPEDLDIVDAGKEVMVLLANPKIQEYLHGSTRCLGNWDLKSRKFLDLVHSSQQSPDIFRPGKSAAIYYGWSVANALRVSTSFASMAVETSAVGKGLSLFSNGVVALLGGIHGVLMKRDDTKAKESYYRERSGAYSNTEGALAYLVSKGPATHEDTKAFLDASDAWKKIPYTSTTAKLDHDKAGFAAKRETFFPFNVVASTSAQVLGLVTTGMPWGYVIAGLLGASGGLYAVQAYFDLRQGGVEHTKATQLCDFARKWQEEMNTPEVQTWLQDDDNKATYTAFVEYMTRMDAEQTFEACGGGWRMGKGAANIASSAGSIISAFVQAFATVKPTPSTVMGTWVAFISMCYMAFTATKMAKRNSAGVTRTHLQRHAQITEALSGRDDITKAMLNPGRPLTLDRPAGTYDERRGFLITKMDVEPGGNEYHAMARLAEHVAEYTRPFNPALHKKDLVDMIARQSHTPPLEWRAMLDYAQGIQDDHRRLDFIKRRLAPGYKTEFRLEPGTEREARLRPEILIHAAIEEVKTLAEGLREFRVDASLDVEQFAGEGKDLYKALRKKGFFNRFEETAFVHAMDVVWGERIPCTEDTDARNALHQVQLVAQHIIKIRSQRSEDVLLNLSLKDGDLIRKTLLDEYPGLDEKSVKRMQASFLMALKRYLTAENNHDRKAMLSAANALSRNPVVQRLITEAAYPDIAPRGTLLSRLGCRKSLKPILRMLDWDPILLKNGFKKAPQSVTGNMDGAEGKGSATESGDEEGDYVVDVRAALKPGTVVGNDADNQGVENDTGPTPTERKAQAPSAKARQARITGLVRRTQTRRGELTDQIKALVKGSDTNRQAGANPFVSSNSSSSQSEDAPLIAVGVEGDDTYSSQDTHGDSMSSTKSYAQSPKPGGKSGLQSGREGRQSSSGEHSHTSYSEGAAPGDASGATVRRSRAPVKGHSGSGTQSSSSDN